MNVYLEDGRRISLDNSDVIGSGGEGSVFRMTADPNNVIKIYENPTVSQGKKLSAFMSRNFSLPLSVAAPNGLVSDGRQRIVGFRMPFFMGTKAIRELAVKKYRTMMKISNLEVADIMTLLATDLLGIHRQGLVVGDLNDLNVLFTLDKPLFIDVDSWQFDNWPCPVATENYLDPNLYNLDLSAKPVFEIENDWYSYAVLLFRSLLLTHPYGGTHSKMRTLPERATNRVMVFDKGVTYPSIAYPPEVLSDDLSQIFCNYFQSGWRGIFPIDELRKYQTGLRMCNGCGNSFPSNRRFCPVCKEQNQATIQVSIPGSVTIGNWLTVPGNIVYSRVVKDKLIIVSVERNQAVLYLVNQKNKTRMEIGEYLPEMRFEASDVLLGVNYPGSNEIECFEIFNGRLLPIDRLESNVYLGNQRAAFRIIDNSIYRIVGANLIQTQYEKGRPLNYQVRQVVSDQTWFYADNDNQVLVGAYRVLRQMFFWLQGFGRSADLPVPQLDSGESLVDLTIKSSSEFILILRKTKFNGLDWIREDLFDNNGRWLKSKKLPSNNLPSESIHGLAFARGKVIFPTDDGAVRFDPMTEDSVVFGQTKKLIKNDQNLYAFLSGLLIVSSDKVDYLTIN